MRRLATAIVAIFAWAASLKGTTAASIAAHPPAPIPIAASPCDVCVNFTLVPPAPIYDLIPLRFTYNYSQEAASDCAAYYEGFAQSSIDAPYNELVAQGVAAPLLTTFELGPFACSPTSIQFCATFASRRDAQVFEPYLRNLTTRVSDEFNTFVCPSTTGGYRLNISTSPADGCLSLSSTSACGMTPDPFPNCKCNKTRGITPLYVNPIVAKQDGRTNRTTLYCFRINRLPEEARVPSECSDMNTLSKAEIWADNNLRSHVRNIRVTPSSGSPKWMKPSWGGAPVRDALKVTPINWSLDDSVGGEICLEVTAEVPLSAICMGGSCFMSLFSEKRSCCPAYAATTSIF